MSSSGAKLPIHGRDHLPFGCDPIPAQGQTIFGTYTVCWTGIDCAYAASYAPGRVIGSDAAVDGLYYVKGTPLIYSWAAGPVGAKWGLEVHYLTGSTAGTSITIETGNGYLNGSTFVPQSGWFNTGVTIATGGGGGIVVPGVYMAFDIIAISNATPEKLMTSYSAGPPPLTDGGPHWYHVKLACADGDVIVFAIVLRQDTFV